MSIIDEMDAAFGSATSGKQERPRFKPSTFNPIKAYPEHLLDELKTAGHEMYQGGQKLGQGHILGGALDVGLGAARGLWSPTEAGIRTAAYPAAEATGIPEEYLDIGANLALIAPAAVRGAGGLARRFMGVGGRGAEEAAPIAEATTEPRIGATNRSEWERAYADRRAAYQQRVEGGRMAQMEEAAGRTPPLHEQFFPETPVESTRAIPGEIGYVRKPWVSPEAGAAEDMMFGGRRMFPEQQLPSPAIRLPDQRPKWARPETESAMLMPGIGRRPEEVATGFGAQRMRPEQQIPDYSLGTFAEKAAGRSGQMREEAQALREAIPQMDYGTKRTRNIKRPATAEPATTPMSKEQKLKTVEAEGVRSLYDTVRVFETSGMTGTEAEKLIMNNIRNGSMTAIKANGSPLTPKEAKKIRSLAGLGGVSWVRG